MKLKRDIQGRCAFPISFQSCCNAIIVADWVQLWFVFVWYLFVIMISFDSLNARRSGEPNISPYPHTLSVVLFGLCCVVGIEHKRAHTHTRRPSTPPSTRHTTCTRESKWERRRHTKKKKERSLSTNRFASNWIFTDRVQLPLRTTHWRPYNQIIELLIEFYLPFSIRIITKKWNEIFSFVCNEESAIYNHVLFVSIFTFACVKLMYYSNDDNATHNIFDWWYENCVYVNVNEMRWQHLGLWQTLRQLLHCSDTKQLIENDKWQYFSVFLSSFDEWIHLYEIFPKVERTIKISIRYSMIGTRTQYIPNQKCSR